jgi:N-acetylmuramoyl-L-alanine amidase
MRPQLLLLVGLVLLTLEANALATRRTIVIDPGHGGTRPSGSAEGRTLSSPNNAKTPSGLLEKDLTLELSEEICRSLTKKGFTTVQTRIDDTNPDFSARALTAAKANPSAIISIHFNASADHSALGTLAMVSARERNPNYEADYEFAVQLTEAAASAIERFVPGSKARPVINDAHLHGGMGSNFFCQLAKHRKLDGVPKCFLELEFIDRADVEKALIAQREAAFPEIAENIADFLSEYLSREQRGTPR